jgi:dolichyl-phosphate-mannose--protein O-mannosyl transferase
MVNKLKLIVLICIYVEEQVNCGDAIRLEHALTKRNLHSEEIYQSMITKGQEISCYGHEGLGNESIIFLILDDNWVIKCLNKKDGDEFFGGDVFELVHENTDKKVKMSKYYEYSYANWENCPFQGQLEVSGTAASTRETQFKIIGGVFFRES